MGARGGTARCRARLYPTVREPRGLSEPLRRGWGGGGARAGGKFAGPSPDDNFDILLSLENFEIGINAAVALICKDSRYQNGGAELNVLLMSI